MILGILFITIGLLTQSIIAGGNDNAAGKCKTGWTQLNLTRPAGTDGPVCVKINPKKATFLEAVQQCRNEGGELATILNSDSQLAVHHLIKEKHWIGLSDYNAENTFKWVSGHPSVPAVFWAVGEPDDDRGQQDCVAIDPSKQANISWYDDRCMQKLPSVCMIANFTAAPSKLVLETVNGTCPKSFFRMGNRCLQFFTTEKLTFEAARNQCQKLWPKLNSDLASIYSAEEQNILTAMMFNQSTAVWIGLHLIPETRTHSWARGLYDVSFTNWKSDEPNGGLSHSNAAEQCVMMYRRSSSPGEWNDQKCDMKLGYICGVDLQPGENDESGVNPLFKPSQQCRKGENEFDGFCFKSLDKEVTSYDEAQNACGIFHKYGHVTTPRNAYEIAFTSVIMNHLKINYTLLGFQIKEVGTSSPQNPSKEFQITPASSIGFDSLKGIKYYEVKGNSCLASTGDPRHYVTMANCTSPKPFKAICSYPLKTSSFHPEQKQYDCPKTWTSITNGRCIKPFHDSKTMYEAKQECMKQHTDGSLVSVLDVHDQQHVSALARKMHANVWIGLEVNFDLSGNLSTVRWVDAQPVRYLHWRAGEPTLTSRSGKEENCVVIRQKSHDWNNVACSKSYPFICSIPGTVKAPPTPSTPESTTPPSTAGTPSTSLPSTSEPTSTPTPKPKPKPTPTCSSKFDEKHLGNCYKIILKRIHWHDAEKECQSLSDGNSHLVSIHSLSEQKFVHSIMKKKNISESLWIGLSDLYDKVENQFSYWSDSTSMTVMFMNKSQDNFIDNQDCVVFSPTSKSILGTWNRRHCTTAANGYICKWAPKKEPPLPRPEPKAVGSYCRKGFVKFSRTCYRLMTTPEISKKAEQECKNLFPENYWRYVTLARIDSVEVNDFLLSLLSPIKNHAAWIGMHYEDESFHWTDNWPVKYTRWPVNMTGTNKDTTCVALGASTVTILSGFWYARNCHEKLPFICQAPLLSKEPTSSLSCNEGYSLYEDGKTCYRRLKKPTTFDDGKKQCEADKERLHLKTRPTLLNIDSVFEMSFVRAWMMESGAPLDRSFWVGLKLQPGKPVWKWISGEPVDFTYTSGLPEDISGCYYMYVHRKITTTHETSTNVYGMHPDPLCGKKEKRVTVCKYSLESKAIVPKPRECLATQDGIGYTGHLAVTKSGKACVRWDTLNDIHLLVQLNQKIGGSDSNFCRNPSGKHQRDRPYCYTTRGKSSEKATWDYCDIPLCFTGRGGHVGSHSYVVAVAILVIVLLVTISFFVGVMLWRRTNTARGFIPYLRQHDPEGGTSFHNPIYTPAANC